MTKPTGKPKGRPPGRPKGSRDARPVLLGLLERYRLYPVLMAEFEKAKEEMTAKERFQFSLELARLGIVASPKTMDLAEPMHLSLIINGVRQVKAIDGYSEPVGELPDATPRALAPVDDSWNERMPPGKAAVCDPFKGIDRRRPVAPRPLQEENEPPRGPVLIVPGYDEVKPLYPEWEDEAGA